MRNRSPCRGETKNSRNESSCLRQKTESAFDPVSGPVDFEQIGYFLYQNLHGKSGKGYDAPQMKVSDSRKILQTCEIGKKPRGQEAYSGLAETYMEQDEGMRQNPYFFPRLQSYPSNEELYRAAISFYEETAA